MYNKHITYRSLHKWQKKIQIKKKERNEKSIKKNKIKSTRQANISQYEHRELSARATCTSSPNPPPRRNI